MDKITGFIKAAGKAIGDSLTVVSRELEYDEFTDTVRVTSHMKSGGRHLRVYRQCSHEDH